MDNRRRETLPPNQPRPAKPFNQNRTDRSADADKTFGVKRLVPRENTGGRFQNQDERFQIKGGAASQNQERKFQSREVSSGSSDGGKTRPRNDGFQKRDERFAPRGEKSQTSGRFAAKDRNFKPKWEREQEQQPLPPIVSELQITDGKHRGTYLTTTASAKMRLTARRVREAMFRILFRRVRAGRFLDLCAGSGMVGLEAISRGALLCTFVERSPKMCGIIKKNMESCAVKIGHGEVICAEAAPFLKQIEKRRRVWDVVYYDPPYDADYDEVLNFFARGAALKTRGVLVVEHHAEMFFPETFGALSRWRVLVQGETALTFYEKK